MSDDDDAFEEPTAPAWMATFGDLMSLLLTFFVLLMSFASMDQRRFAAVVGSMRDAFGVQQIHPGQLESLSDSIVVFSDREATPYLRVIDQPMDARRQERQALNARIQLVLRSLRIERQVEVEESPRGVAVRVPGRLLFEPGSSDLTPESQIFLREMADVVNSMPDEVAIEGHTDDSPIGQGRFRSNWELASSRAVAALQYLVDVGGVDPKRLRATGYGSTRPLVANHGEAERATNRRIEFVFLRTEPTVNQVSSLADPLRSEAPPSQPSGQTDTGSGLPAPAPATGTETSALVADPALPGDAGAQPAADPDGRQDLPASISP